MNTLLLSVGRHLLPVPQIVWQREMKQGSVADRKSLGFMSDDHHRVRDYVVVELARRGEAISAKTIAGDLDLSVEQVSLILDELESHLTFLFRNEAGDVCWAYPVTCAPTPHRVFFNSGEQIYAA